jgi:hypothetical protein
LMFFVMNSSCMVLYPRKKFLKIAAVEDTPIKPTWMIR